MHLFPFRGHHRDSVWWRQRYSERLHAKWMRLVSGFKRVLDYNHRRRYQYRKRLIHVLRRVKYGEYKSNWYNHRNGPDAYCHPGKPSRHSGNRVNHN
jgi:hypothetical protein